MTRRLFAHPVGFAGLCLILLSLTLTLGGPDTIVLWDRPFLLRPPGHVLGLGYGLVLLRAVFVWCEERPWREGVLSPGARMVLGWHILPCALWFLTPQALLTFIWFVGPTHRGASAGYDPAAALLFHWRGFAGGFHLSYWSAALCLILAAIGLPRLLRGGPGERAVAMFALLSAAAVVLHPQQQARFQATGLFAVWICAGVGAGVGAGMLAAAWRAWVPRAPAWTGALAVAALFILTCLGPRAPSARVDAAAIRAPGAPSDLALSEAWLPLAGNTRGLGFIAPFARSDLFAWSVHARCRCRVPVEQPWLQPATTREEFAALTAAWLAGLAADHVILIDAPAQHPSPASVPRAQLLGARDALDTQTRFIASEAAPIAAGAATITVWRLAEGTAMPPAPQPRKLFGALSVAMALAILTRLALARLALARTR